MTTYCKATECEWNKWDQQNLKHRCNKSIVHIDKKGWCYLSQYARPIASQPKEVENFTKNKGR